MVSAAGVGPTPSSVNPDPSSRRLPRGIVVLALLAAALRVPSVGLSAFPDEAGYLLVARGWRGVGPGLYGTLWVDRPPLLMEFWRMADTSGGIIAARWLACGLVAVLVLTAGSCGLELTGRRGAWASALIAAALGTSPLIGAREVDGELLAAPLLMLGCLGALRSLACGRRPLTQGVWALAAGVVGGSAILVKQNFVDALFFALFLGLLVGIQRRVPWAAVRRHTVLVGVGAAIPLSGAAWWAIHTSAGLDALWYAMYGFRSQAAQVIMSQNQRAPAHRLIELSGLAIVSGILCITAVFVWSGRRHLRDRAPAPMAVGVMLGLGYMEILVGGSYWSHYLIGLVPALSLAAALCCTAVPARRGRLAIALVVASSLAATAGTAVYHAPNAVKSAQVSAALRQAREPGDSGYVAYGHPNVLLESDVLPAYRYLWSLPLRTRDPALDGLVSQLSGASAPTWVVQWEALNSWGIDRDGRFAQSLEDHYVEVADVCGAVIYLRRGTHRSVPPSSACG